MIVAFSGQTHLFSVLYPHKILWNLTDIWYFVYTTAGADPGFLERGFLCTKVLGIALLISSHFS